MESIFSTVADQFFRWHHSLANLRNHRDAVGIAVTGVFAELSPLDGSGTMIAAIRPGTPDPLQSSPPMSRISLTLKPVYIHQGCLESSQWRVVLDGVMGGLWGAIQRRSSPRLHLDSSSPANSHSQQQWWVCLGQNALSPGSIVRDLDANFTGEL